MISAELILEYCGEDSLLQVNELLLRNLNVSSFDKTCLSSLSQLEMLSLSHNQFTDISYFGLNFFNLQILNLNNNEIVSIDGLRGCKNLEKLYLAGNMIVDISTIGSLNKLSTLCLFRNSIGDMDHTLLQLRLLPKLKSLDLDGNPLSHDASYKHTIIQMLPRLQSLDNTSVSSLDRELADESTLPTQQTKNKHFITAKSARMYDTEELNSNPIVLRYLSECTINTVSTSTNDHIEAKEKDIEEREEEERRSRPKSFVDRIRRNTHRSPREGKTNENLVQLPSLPDPMHLKFQSENNIKEDISDPCNLIRKLLKTVEMLQAERDMLIASDCVTMRKSQDEQSLKLLNLEMASLKMENSNMYTLLGENKDLKLKVSQLEKENGELKEKVKDCEGKLKNFLVNQENVIKKEAPQQNKVIVEEEESKDDDDEDDEDEEDDGVDAEITDLINRNAESLRQIRHDTNALKKEIMRAEIQSSRPRTARSEKSSSFDSLSDCLSFDSYTLSSNRPQTSNGIIKNPLPDFNETDIYLKNKGRNRVPPYNNNQVEI